MKLLILHINSSFGGAERTTDNVLKHLDRTLIQDITLVSFGAIQGRFDRSGYNKFIDLQSYGVNGWFVNLKSLLRDARIVSGILKQEAPDVVFSVMHYPSALLVFSCLLFGVRTKKIVTFRGPIYEHMKHYESGIKRRFFLRTVISITSRFADRVLVPSQGVRRELINHFFTKEEKVEVIPNGIDLELVEEKKSRTVDDCEILSNKEHPVLCSASRLSPEKNLSLLLHAFALVRSKIRTYLVFIGSGAERDKLQRISGELGLRDSVFFLGEKDNVLPYVYNSDVYLHSCLFEGFGYGIIEAMACGTPVISTDCPYGPGEIINGNKYGILVPMNDPESLANAVVSLLKDKKRQAELSSLGKKRAQELSVLNMVRRYEKVFLTV